jgi:presenilin-like A22 family membrane protease
MLLFLIAVQVFSLALMPAFLAGSARVFEDPQSTANPIIYVLLILGFTFLLLIAIKLRQGWVVNAFITISVAMSVYYILASLIPSLPSMALALAAVLLLRLYPEWYVIDAIGILICAGISALFGISMTVLPVLILLVVLAVYDAISVYKTRHMVALAEGAIKIKAPLLFVVPRKRGYSFRLDQGLGEERGAFFLGLGDAVIPTILAVSASWSLPAAPLPGLAVSAPALGAMLGTYIGFAALLTTSRERPQAGLPFLNGGAMLGFMIGCALAGISPF